MIVQFAGLLLATQLYSGISYQQVQGSQTVSSSVNVFFILAYVIVVAVVMLFILKVYKGRKLFIIFEGVVIFVASLFVFFIIAGIIQGPGQAFSNIFGNISLVALVASVVAAVALIIAKNKIPRLRNFTAMFSSVGVGLVLGLSFSFLAALVFMVILAIYDFIAVFITKHMIALGNMAIENNLALLVMVNEVEAVPLSSLSSTERKEYNLSKNEIKKQGGIAAMVANNDMVPVASRAALGTGDLAIPLMLAVAAYKVHFNFVLPFVIVFGAIFGLVLTLFILRKYKRALPAIPPLLFGILVALAVFFLYTML